MFSVHRTPDTKTAGASFVCFLCSSLVLFLLTFFSRIFFEVNEIRIYFSLWRLLLLLFYVFCIKVADLSNFIWYETHESESLIAQLKEINENYTIKSMKKMNGIDIAVLFQSKKYYGLFETICFLTISMFAVFVLYLFS